MSLQPTHFKEAIDRALADGITEEAVEALLAMLVPGRSDSLWPNLELVLGVAEHPVVADALRTESAPEPLVEALDHALSALSPLLGPPPVGPIYQRAEMARRRLEREARKHQIVVDALKTREGEEAERVVRNYLRTDPAPLFVARLRQQHLDLLDAAEEQVATDADLRPLSADASLVEQLREVPADVDADELGEALDRLWDSLDRPEELVRLGVAAAAEEHQLVAAALGLRKRQYTLAPLMLRRVVMASPVAPQLCVFAARLDAGAANHTLSTFLFEAAWINPEEPEIEMTPARAAALLAARWVLPRVDSPLSPIAADALPADIAPIASLLERLWPLAGALKG